MEAKQSLPALKKEYEKALRRYIESLITVYGYAWCMDVKSERRKMAILVAKLHTTTDFTTHT
jgi:hypothetical protein